MKKFFSIVAAMLLMVGAVSAKTIYCKAPAWWAAGTVTGIYAWGDGVDAIAEWPGVRMTAVQGEENTWSMDLDDKYTMLVFTRMNPSNEGDQYWGAKSEDLSIPADKDLYTITTAEQTWDPAKVQGAWSVYGEAAPDVLPVVALGANFNGWNWQANLLTAAEDKMSASIKVNLGVTDSIEFKIVSDGSWLSLNGEGETLYKVHRDWPKAEHVNLINNGRNFSLITDVEGEYVFTWIYADSSLYVTFPAKSAELPYVALIGTMNNWDGSAANQLVPSEDQKTASAKFNLDMNDKQGYEFKILVGSMGLSAKGEGDDEYGLNREWTSCKLDWVDVSSKPIWLAIDVAGEYTFTYTYADSTLTVTFPEKGDDPQVLANGYYLMGIINGAESTWDYAALKAEHLFARNEGSTEVEEYQLEVTLAENDQIQVVSCNNGNVGDWYPGGEGNNYVVDADHAGEVTIYFRPARNGGDDWWHNCIYVAPKEGSGITHTAVEAKAVKTIMNGQLVILKGDKVFNAIGTQIQ